MDSVEGERVGEMEGIESGEGEKGPFFVIKKGNEDVTCHITPIFKR